MERSDGSAALSRRAFGGGAALGIASFALPSAAASASYVVPEVSESVQFDNPTGIDVASDGTVHIADYSNHRIRRISSTGVVSTLAGGIVGDDDYPEGGTFAAQFDNPMALRMDGSGVLWVADLGNHRIRRVTADGTVTTFAGSTAGYQNGVGAAAKFYGPAGLDVDGTGTLVVSEANSGNRLRTVTTGAEVALLAGSEDGSSAPADGTGSAAGFSVPRGVAWGGDDAYTVDETGLRRVTSAGVTSTVTLSPSTSWTAADRLLGLVADPAVAGGFLATRIGSQSGVYAIAADGTVTLIAGGSRGSDDGTGAAASFNDPYDLSVHPVTGDIFVADTLNHLIRRVTRAGVVTTYAGSGVGGFADTPVD